MLSRDLYQAIEENLKNKLQTILFLNRRGYSTFIMCRNCGYTVKCKNCNISMTYHSYENKLKCHYCGYEEKVVKICPECGSDKIRYFGTGTQKLEQEILNNIDDVVIYGDKENRMPSTTSIAFKGVSAEVLMLRLEAFGIYVSTGSACNSEIAEPSHVLTSLKADLENYSPIRISLSKYTTEEDIDTFIKSLINIINMIRK